MHKVDTPGRDTQRVRAAKLGPAFIQDAYCHIARRLNPEAVGNNCKLAAPKR
jgi:hypothetical protein